MQYLSVCSGIEAATVAWHHMGWAPVGFSEIEPFPSAVLEHHYPWVPNLGDMTKYKEWNIERPDILVGGTPCQSFSVAGLRKGLDDPRGNLALVYCGLLDHFRPKWFVWENVPGVLSSNGGRDFGSFLGALVELGYGFAYRILDAQYFGVAQRRRRVFVVGYLGDYGPPASVLFERESLRRNPAPSREKGQKIANSLTERPDRGGGNSEGQRLVVGRKRPSLTPEITGALTARFGAAAMGAPEVDAGLYIPTTQYGDLAASLTARFDSSPCADRGAYILAQPTVGALCARYFKGVGSQFVNEGKTIPHGMAVRRLTPVECERLQGFPDNYTNIPWRKSDESPDGPRYKALGNSMAVPVMRWIGERIKLHESL